MVIENIGAQPTGTASPVWATPTAADGTRSAAPHTVPYPTAPRTTASAGADPGRSAVRVRAVMSGSAPAVPQRGVLARGH
uniref:hypothetical protein n=1 Tax=Streptomyces caniscabiei TaxID=2746961 RepID=UPI001C4F701C